MSDYLVDYPTQLHPFHFPCSMTDAVYGKSAVTELAPDVWQVEGCLGINFFCSAPSANAYILRDKDMVILFDPGMQPFYRSRILELLRKYKAAGCKTLVLIDSQGHWDHALNNSVVLEAGFENLRFLLPEPEVAVIDCQFHWLGDFKKLEAFFNPYAEWMVQEKEIEKFAQTCTAYSEPYYAPVWDAIKKLGPHSNYADHRAALRLLIDRVLIGNKRNLSEMAEILTIDSREKRTYGDTEWYGWQVGRFFIIHDGAHSPGHVCLYDPLNKLALTGDVTIEINPPFFDSNFNKIVDAAKGFRRMSEQGFITLASDAHRSKTFFPLAVEAMNMKDLIFTPLQLEDCMRGEDQCIEFFSGFEKFYSGMRRDILQTISKLGEATIDDIVTEWFKLDTPQTKFKKCFHFPSRPHVLVTRVLDEFGYNRRVSGDKILFSLKESFRF